MGSAPAQEEPLTRAYDWTTDSPCFAVIDAIARYEGVETPRMAQKLPALQQTIDTDAFNTLISASTPTTLSFEYGPYHVYITRETITISSAARMSH